MNPWHDKERAEDLLGLMAGLVAASGPEPLLAAPLVEETPRFFPDTWEPSLVGLGRVLHRLMCYAGLEGWNLDLIDARDPLADESLGAQQPVIDFIEARLSWHCWSIAAIGG